ncbi:hypothetical protein J3A64_004315 [Pseudarthrobacter sp. PvP004]|uniref:hypothetical protein n=1 Tax=Pseudarthrobacter sp. PvP004 TaxID=2817850 RepID=UPI0025700893|nr:hypothetical protein [Pseudarthrobacter sp. PvP004]MBP2268851.1 hypothetical protein [Pseudarthrobacter sp. PvP004]
MTGAIAKQPREEFSTKALTKTDRFDAAPPAVGEVPRRPRGPAPADAAGVRRRDALGLHRRIQLLAGVQNAFGHSPSEYRYSYRPA